MARGTSTEPNHGGAAGGLASEPSIRSDPSAPAGNANRNAERPLFRRKGFTETPGALHPRAAGCRAPWERTDGSDVRRVQVVARVQPAERGGPKKVAERLVGNLRKAIEQK